MKHLFLIIIVLLPLQLSAQFTQCYTINTTAVYDPDDFSSGTQVSFLNDDQYSQAVPIGFPFCFYGNMYDSVVISANGYISFETSRANTWSSFLVNYIHTPTIGITNPTNSIFLAWQDLAIGGTVKYITYGTYPHRSFVVSFDSIPYFPGMFNCLHVFTAQVQLFETSNIIQINIEQLIPCYSSESGNSTMGLQNATGTMSAVPYRDTTSLFTILGWNKVPWNASHQAFKFTPTCSRCNANVGLPQEDPDFYTQVFPNPTSGNITITTNADQLLMAEIYNALGQKIRSFSLSQQNMHVSLGDQPDGVYFIYFRKDEKNMGVQKILIRH
jgi:hypothetical protein